MSERLAHAADLVESILDCLSANQGLLSISIVKGPNEPKVSVYLYMTNEQITHNRYEGGSLKECLMKLAEDHPELKKL